MIKSFSSNLLLKYSFSRFVSSVSTNPDSNLTEVNNNLGVELVDALIAEFPNHSSAVQNLLGIPLLQRTNIGQWKTFICSLKAFGFDVSDSLKILSREPQAISIPNGALESALTRWNSSPISNELMKFLLINRPELLFLTPINVEKRMPSLQQFVSNQKSLTLLLLNCPNVLTEKWESVQEKIDYLMNVMLVEKSEIVNSSALNKTIEHIKLRHTLLERCGMYLAPNKYEHKRIKNEKLTFRNPPLKRIVDNEDVSFSRKICKITAEEYEVYKTMFDDDLKNDGEYNSEEDSDSE